MTLCYAITCPFVQNGKEWIYVMPMHALLYKMARNGFMLCHCMPFCTKWQGMDLCYAITCPFVQNGKEWIFYFLNICAKNSIIFKIFCSFQYYTVMLLLDECLGSNRKCTLMPRAALQIMHSSLIMHSYQCCTQASPSCCIGNALLAIRALFAMQPSAFACIFYYSLGIHPAILQYTLHSPIHTQRKYAYCIHRI